MKLNWVSDRGEALIGSGHGGMRGPTATPSAVNKTKDYVDRSATHLEILGPRGVSAHWFSKKVWSVF